MHINIKCSNLNILQNILFKIEVKRLYSCIDICSDIDFIIVMIAWSTVSWLYYYAVAISLINYSYNYSKVFLNGPLKFGINEFCSISSTDMFIAYTLYIANIHQFHHMFALLFSQS